MSCSLDPRRPTLDAATLRRFRWWQVLLLIVVCLFGVAAAYALTGRLEEAVALHQRMLKQFPNFLGSYLHLVAIYSELGQEAEARAAAAEVLRINPEFSLEIHKRRTPIKDSAMLERHIAALRRAELK